MRERYLVILGPRPAVLEHQLALLMQSADGEAVPLTLVAETATMMAMVGGGLEATDLPRQGGVILGTVFDRATATPQRDMPSHIAASGGRTLIDGFWGRYTAILGGRAGREWRVLRDPSGALPCYRGASGGVAYLCSEPMLAVEAGLLDPAIDWTFAAQFLAYPHLRTSRSGLTDLTEILPGCCATINAAGVHLATLWTPWTFTHAQRRIDDIDEASAILRDAIARCTAALASRYHRIALELSGGLDSSLIAASLDDADTGLSLINIATAAAEGDERHYARDMARQIGRPLHEIVLGSDAIPDLRRPPAARLARPGAHAVAQAWDDALLREAVSAGADAFFSGTGGDNILCSLASPAPFTDRVLARGWRPAAAQTLVDVATIHRCTVWKAMQMAWRQRRRLRGGSRWTSDPSFLKPGAMPAKPDAHPWFDEPDDALPGKRHHIWSLMAVHSHIEGYTRQRFAPVIHPLLAQPVVETCLRIPTWLWVEGGRDRSVARHAFAGSVPQSILDRRTKGRMNSYCAEMFDLQRDVLADLLLDGHLARHDVLDRDALAAYLATPGPPRDDRFFRVLAIADAEAWVRSWLESDTDPLIAAPAASPPSVDTARL